MNIDKNEINNNNIIVSNNTMNEVQVVTLMNDKQK